MLLTRAPLYLLPEGSFRVRLACLRHAASVDSEPGSNSRYKFVLWNIIRYWLLSYSVSIMTLASFRRELYRSRLTLKGLETDTLYLVFKDRSPNCIWIALQTIPTRPKQTGILTNDLDSVKQPRRILLKYRENKKRRNILTMLRGQATLKVVSNSRFSNPLMPLQKRNGHYRDKNQLVNTSQRSQSFLFACVRPHVFKCGS